MQKVDVGRITASLELWKEKSLLEKFWSKVKYITAYVLVLNPTELCFNLLKQQTKKQRSRNYEEMKNAVERAIELLNQKDLSKYFDYCVNYFEKNM